jgi:hypothetical protein
MKKFRKAWVPNTSYRISQAPILEIADDVVVVCETPIFDDLLGKENKSRFEDVIAAKMEGFDPKRDVIVFYGDPMIFALMIVYVTIFIAEEGEAINIGRWSTKQERYLVREVADKMFPGYID